MDKEKLIKIARGDVLADLVLINAQVVNVFSKTIETGNIAISDGVFIGMGDYHGKKTIDLKGKYIAPGFIDGHVHIESSMLTPEGYAKATMPRGTTSVVADCHEIANVAGVRGIDYMLASAKRSKQDVFMMIPSCVPATQFEHNGQILLSETISRYVKHPSVKGLGEMMDYVGTVQGDSDINQKITDFQDLVIDGHAPGLKGKALNAYCLAGVETDHECTTPNELMDKVKRGMYIHLREGSQTKNVADLLPGLSPKYYSRILMCSDDLHPKDILEVGHIDHNINIAIEHGVEPIEAIAMATINICNCYHLKNLGAIAPGYQADFVVFDQLKKIEVDQVYKRGECVVEEGKAIFEIEPLQDESILNTVHIRENQIDLTLKSQNQDIHVIGLNKDSIITENLIEKVKLRNGIFEARDNRPLLKLVAVERHHYKKFIGKGVVKGFGFKNGAIAMTIAHDSHNIVCVGDNDEDMMRAIIHLKQIQGGICVASNQKIMADLPLEVGGLMSLNSVEYVKNRLDLLTIEVNKLGMNEDIGDPFVLLAFLCLPVVPSLKLTDLGLFDVGKFKIISIEASDKS